MMSSARVYDLAVVNGVLALPDGERRGGLGVIDGRIATLADDGVPLAAEREIDAAGRLVLPGGLDIHVHFRDPGLTHKEDFATGTRAAARGGVTFVADMPNTVPPGSTPERIAAKLDESDRSAYVDFSLWAAGTHDNDPVALRKAGADGLKIYMAKPEKPEQEDWQGGESPYLPELFVEHDDALLRLFAAAASIDMPVAVHVGNQRLRLASRLPWNGRGFASILDELASESTLGDREATAKCIMFARETGAQLHLVHVRADVLDLVVAARRDGVRVTAESLCPFMPFSDAERLGTLGFDRYRSDAEIEALWAAMRDGVIDNIGTDHAPHTLAEKALGETDILSCPSGYPELETALPMLLDAVNRGVLRLADLVRLRSQRPAEVLGLSGRKGALALGADADLVIADLHREWTLGADDLETKCGWTPFAGRTVRGSVDVTLVRGEPVYADSAIVGGAGFGQGFSGGRPVTAGAVAEVRR